MTSEETPKTPAAKKPATKKPAASASAAAAKPAAKKTPAKPAATKAAAAKAPAAKTAAAKPASSKTSASKTSATKTSTAQTSAAKAPAKKAPAAKKPAAKKTSTPAWVEFYPESVKAEIDAVPYANIGEMVKSVTSRFADKPAFTNLGVNMTFRQVDELSDAFAAYLVRDLGLKKGDRLAIQMPNLLQYAPVLYGALKAGITVININPLYTASEMLGVFKDSEPSAIVILANFADKLESILDQTSIKHVLITQVGDMVPGLKKHIVNAVVKHVRKMVPAFKLPGAIKLSAALKASSNPVELPETTLDDIAFLQYTGGTTGGVKAAMLTHRNMMANQAQFIGLMEAGFPNPNPRIIAALPLYHIFSLTVNLFGFFLLGGLNILVTNPREIPDFVKTIKEHKPNGMILVSTLAGALLENEEFRGLDFSELNLTVAGGMAVRRAVSDRWKQATGKDIIEGYGLTEASPVVSVNPPHLPARIGTIGVPLPSTEVRILDDSGKELPLGEAGELAVRGPQVMQGYWKNEEATKATITKDGWLLTGDIATIDKDGYLTIVDRKKELIIVSGFNVYPSELEDAAMLHPKVLEAGAIGIEDEKSGEVPKLFVVKRDESLTEQELKDYLAQKLTNYKRPREIAFRDELPKTNVGKVLRRMLK